MTAIMRWGVLGTGKIIARGGRAIQEAEGCVWLGVAGRNRENSEAAARTYGVERSYDTYRELLDDPDIDAVYIALLTHLHGEWAVAALESGKHVLLEKPAGLNAAEVERIAATARARGLLFREAFVWRHQEAYSFARETIREGAIGELGHIAANFTFAADPANTRLVKEWGGGALYDVGCYPVAWSRYFMEAEPHAVDASFEWGATGVDTRFVGTLHFPGGRTAQVGAALDLAGGSAIALVGTKGRLTFGYRVDNETLTITISWPGGSRDFATDRVTPFRRQVDSFVQALRSGEAAAQGTHDAVLQSRVLDALFASSDLQRRVTVG